MSTTVLMARQWPACKNGSSQHKTPHFLRVIHTPPQVFLTGIWLETCEPEAAVSMKTTGFTGGSCREATRELERALGMSGRESLLPEFFNQNSTGEQIRQRS